jgi:hypothetical protein
VDSIKNNKWKLEAKTKILTKDGNSGGWGAGGGVRTRETKIKSLSSKFFMLPLKVQKSFYAEFAVSCGSQGFRSGAGSGLDPYSIGPSDPDP